jgi:predicted alpha/beta-hydrolase family hydrolase
MTSQAQALRPLGGVQALVFFGFPLHAAGRPSLERARHLSDVHVPMLFIQGSRDKLAERSLIQEVVNKLGPNASLSRTPTTAFMFQLSLVVAMQTSSIWLWTAL